MEDLYRFSYGLEDILESTFEHAINWVRLLGIFWYWHSVNFETAFEGTNLSVFV